MPEDASTIEKLIDRTKNNLAESLIVVLHFNDPAAAVNLWDSVPYGESYGSSVPSTSVMMQIATTYGESEKFGGRPLICLQIDRDLPGMALICSQRNIRTFPTIQIHSRGTCEACSASDLERRLQNLGVASRSRPANVGSRFGGARAVSDPGDADFFGVGSGGSALDASGVGSAMAKASRSTKGEVKSDNNGGRPSLDSKLDMLFGEPNFDDDDMPPPI